MRVEESTEKTTRSVVEWRVGGGASRLFLERERLSDISELSQSADIVVSKNVHSCSSTQSPHFFARPRPSSAMAHRTVCADPLRGALTVPTGRAARDRSITRMSFRTAFPQLRSKRSSNPSRRVALSVTADESKPKGKNNPFDATSGAAKRAADTVSEKATNFWNDEVLGAKKAMDRDASKKPGQDVRASVDCTLEQAILGADVPLTYSRRYVCPTCNGQGRLPQTFIDCDTCEVNVGTITKETSVTVTVPPGIKNGATLRLKDQGDEGTPPGQLYVTVKAANMTQGAVIVRDGDDLITRDVVARFQKKDEPTSIRVQTIEGDWGNLSVPTDAKVGQGLRIKGRGVAKTPGGTERGDHLFVIGKIVVEAGEEEVGDL